MEMENGIFTRRQYAVLGAVFTIVYAGAAWLLWSYTNSWYTMPGVVLMAVCTMAALLQAISPPIAAKVQGRFAAVGIIVMVGLINIVKPGYLGMTGREAARDYLVMVDYAAKLS